ncbi:ribonuclease P protein component [Salegentibacter sp. F188]|uniref:Ribonuclease P protein component n=1 Tax=Autumnicola patrickiae TaxID=3075591 RepID=A0ABU3E3F0_9FLAO|nr:ribonuclease P protein component [Salegentibacter sp. F188]MDT0690450.1 ribonuclease P protein component [Salegentibacter sp. F188]
MDESFGKKEKLKSKKLIEALFQSGKSVKSFPLRLIYIPLENTQNVQFQTGVSVPKRIVKTAVQRNRIKRLMREAYRKNKYLVTNTSGTSYAFMILYMTPKEMGYEELFKAMEKLIGKFKEKEKWEN